MIESILIHECQHKSTWINTNQHESRTGQDKSNESNTSQPNQHESDTINTNQYEYDKSQHDSTRLRLVCTRINTSPTWVNDQETIMVYSSFSW